MGQIKPLTYKHLIPVKLDDELLEILDILAARQKTTRSDIIRNLLRDKRANIYD